VLNLLFKLIDYVNFTIVLEKECLKIGAFYTLRCELHPLAMYFTLKFTFGMTVGQPVLLNGNCKDCIRFPRGTTVLVVARGEGDVVLLSAVAEVVGPLVVDADAGGSAEALREGESLWGGC
jgi:hypothetical protein